MQSVFFRAKYQLKRWVKGRKDVNRSERSRRKRMQSRLHPLRRWESRAVQSPAGKRTVRAKAKARSDERIKRLLLFVKMKRTMFSYKFSPPLKDSGFYEFSCPWCGQRVCVKENEINCTIFRHLAGPKGEQVNPHASQAECARLLTMGYVGCGRGFIFNGREVKRCGYI